MTELPRDIQREMTGLADGSLTGTRRDRAEERVRHSPELRGVLSEQRRTVEALAAVDASAPDSLRRQIDGMLDSAPTRPRAHRAVAQLRAAGAVLAAAVLVALAVVVSSGGGSGGLTVQRTAALTLQAATMPAPSESSHDRSQLSVAVGGVSFPYWRERFGWRSSGARSDRVAGHAVTTVFYTNAGGMRVGYAIASGHAPVVHGGAVVRRWGVAYRVLGHDGATVIAWQRDGHLCVISGRGVSSRTLLSLASWGSETRA